MNKTNILILMTDQQRYDALGCSGNPCIQTPNIDKIAEEGMSFRHAYTVSPVCMPARAAFINGKYPHNFGMWENKGKVVADNNTMFNILKDAGYYTSYIGKTHYYEQIKGIHMRDYEDYIHSLGIDYINEVAGPSGTTYTYSNMTDEWNEKGILDLYKKDFEDRRKCPWLTRMSPLPVENYYDSYVGKKTVEFIDNYDSDQPLCMFVGFPGPHSPWDAPGEYASLYKPKDMPEPIPYQSLSDQVPEYIREKKDFIPDGEITIEDIQNMRANYYGKVSLIDKWIGEILNAIDRKGWLDDLFIIFWSDHGEMAGDHKKFGKGTFYESSIHVPLILRWPGRIPGGCSTDALVETIDVFPTIIEFLNLRKPNECLGNSLCSLINGRKNEHRSSILSEIRWGEYRNIMIRTEQYKYAVDHLGRGYMLYDLKNDPYEQCNYIGDTSKHKLENDMRDILLKRILDAQYVIK